VPQHHVIDRELYLSAKKMIDQYGEEEAVGRAVARAELLHAGGYTEASGAWKRLIAVIEELTSTNRGSAILN
jgi:effector-binding domain-containing protein